MELEFNESKLTQCSLPLQKLYPSPMFGNGQVQFEPVEGS